MASKTSEESKYDAYDDVSDAEEEQQNEVVVVAPPQRRKGGRSGGRSILPPSGKKPNNSSARSRARMQHVKENRNAFGVSYNITLSRTFFSTQNCYSEGF